MPQSQYPVIYAGSNYQAATIQKFSPWFAWKAANTTITATSFTNDPDLTLPVAAGASYIWEMGLLYNGTSGQGPTFGVTFPSGSTTENDTLYVSTAGTLTLAVHSGFGVQIDGTGGNQAAELKGMALIGSTPGSITLEYEVPSASDPTTLLACSWMRLTRVQ